MQNACRFLADEHIELAAVEGLRRAGIDAVSLTEIPLRGAEDRDVLQWAAKQRRLLVTRDRDFLALAAKGVPHQGIVFLTSRVEIGILIRDILRITGEYAPSDLAGVVLFIPFP